MIKNADLEDLTGTIESIVFYSPDTGYTVCRLSREDGEQVTIIGSFPPLSPGEVLKVSGTWEMNPRFGRQLRVENFSPVLPSSEKGIEKFLSSGLILGIGPVLARRIVKKFGPDTIDILSTDPDKLRKVEGVGQVKLREIKKSWAEHEDIRELIIFLQEHLNEWFPQLSRSIQARTESNFYRGLALITEEFLALDTAGLLTTSYADNS